MGLNSWQSASGGPAPASAPGLRSVVFELSDPQSLEELQRAAGAAARRDDGIVTDGIVTVHDPDGEELRFSVRR